MKSFLKALKGMDLKFHVALIFLKLPTKKDIRGSKDLLNCSLIS